MDTWISLVTAIGSPIVAIATIIASSYNSRKQRDHDFEMRKQERDHNLKMHEQERDHNLKMHEQEINSEKELKKQELYITNELNVYKDFVDKYANLQRISTLPHDEYDHYISPKEADREKANAFMASVSHLRLIADIDVDDEVQRLCFDLEQGKYLTHTMTDDLFDSIIKKIKQRQDEIRKT